MQERKGPGPIGWIVTVYALCAVLRAVEYMVLRTDQTIFGEAFLHKLAGILILAAVLRFLSIRWGEIGFSPRAAGKYTLLGLALGLGVYVLAYGT